MAEGTADPPTIKHAGRLSHPGDDIFGLVLAALFFGLIAMGAMLQAVLTSHGRRARGLLLNAAAGLAAFLVIVISGTHGGDLDWGSGFAYPLLAIGLVWLILAALATAVGSIVRPTGRLKRRA
jgi:peptidoglycan/LPS O-acetylase OafA/YrhL